MRIANAQEVKEADLVARARAGDPDALGGLLEEVRPRVWALCRRTLGTSHDVEDAVQETLMRALPRIVGGDFDPARAPLAVWLGRIAFRVCCDHLRKNHYRHRTAPLDAADVHGGIEIEGKVLDALALERCLEGLDEDVRSAFVLLEIEETPYAEAAEILACAIGTLGSRRNRAIKGLKRCLESRLFAESAKDRAGR